MIRPEFFEETDLDRRDLLRAAGVLGAVGLGGYTLWGSDRGTSASVGPSGEPQTLSPPSEHEEQTAGAGEIPHAEKFDAVVLASEVGAPSDGSEPVNFVFEQHAADDTLLAFEPGRYRIDPVHLSDFSGFGIVSTGGDPVRFVPGRGNCRGGHPYVFLDGVADLLLEDVTFDFSNAETGGPIHLFLSGDSTIRNLTYRGTCSNQIGILRIEVPDPDGTAEVENLQARNEEGNNTLTGVYVSGNHAGEVTFRDCRLEEFSDNGLYASSPGGPNGRDGRVNVVGGVYRNNNISNVRLGSTGSRAENVSVVVDSETPGWGQLNSRGIRLRNKAGQVIDNCDITFEAAAADSFGGIVFHKYNGGGLVRDTRIRVRKDNVPAIKAFPDANPGDGHPEFDSLVISGDAGGGLTADIEGRDGTEFRDCTIVQAGPNRKGIRLLDSQDCRIVDSHIHVSEEPLTLHNASVTVESTTFVTPAGREHVEERTLEDEAFEIA